MTPNPTLALHEMHDGGGMPLVLLHPFPLDSRVWKPMAEQLPFGVRAIAVDMPGAGRSDIGGLAPSMDLAADAIHSSLVAHGVGNAIVVGMSMGGYAALALARRYPGFVAGLGLIDTRSTADTPGQAQNRLRLAHEIEMEQSVHPIMPIVPSLLGRTSLEQRRELLPVIEAWIRGQLPAGVAWSLRAMARRSDQTDVLRAFKGPVAVIVGDEDKLSPVPEAEFMATAAPNATLTVVPQTGHLSAYEDPAAVAKALGVLHAQAVPHRKMGSSPVTSNSGAKRRFLRAG